MKVSIRNTKKLENNQGPNGMYSHTCVFYNNKIFIFGGRLPDFASRLNSTWSYDIESQVWEEIEPKNHAKAVFGHTTFLYENKMIVFGGVYALYNYSNDLYSFNFQTNEWKRVDVNQVTIQQRAFHAGTIVKKDIYIFGGESDTGNLNDFYKFNLENLTWKKIETNTSHIHPRVEHSCMYYNNSIIIYGGTRNGEVFFNDIHSFNLDTNTWKEYHSIDGPGRSGMTISHYKDNMILLGGYDGKDKGDLWFYDFKSEKWSEYSKDLLIGRTFYSLQKVNDSFYVFGGHNQEENSVFNEVVQIDFNDVIKIDDFKNFIDVTFDFLSQINERKRKLDERD